MKKIYTSIDLGSDNVKVIVAEKVNGRFHVLASSSVRSVGIKKGYITDVKFASHTVSLAIKEVEEKLGISIRNAIISVPISNAHITIVSGTSLITGFDGEVIGKDISGSIKDAASNKVEDDYEIVTIVPIYFTIDDDTDGVKNPKGLKGNELKVKVVMSSIPRNYLTSIFEVLKNCNIKVEDMAFASTGDYFEVRNQDTESTVGAVVNIGGDKTEVSIFNKGIMIKNEVIPVGSRHIDNDIAYIYRVDRSIARNLKETFAVSNKHYTDSNDFVEIVSKAGEKLIINQYEISEIVESRLTEILKNVKKSINNLTKREISYIIITGGISELAGFQYILETVFGRIATVHNISTMGIRNNKYSSSIGLIKYYDNKLRLRDINYSMIDAQDADELIAQKKKTGLSNDTIISKVFDIFTGNK